MLKGILSISGQSGLFKLVAESKNNIIVESLDTKKRVPVYSSSKVSALEDIAIYTETEDVPLKDIKKVLQWYNVLQEKEMLDFSETEEEIEETESTEGSKDSDSK